MSSMTANGLQRVGLRTSFAGARLHCAPRVACATSIFSTPCTAFFSKTKTAVKEIKKDIKKVAPKKVSRMIPSGKQAKGQRFEVGLGKETRTTITLGFTKSNELFVGRLAMLGIATAIIGELITGKGALAQLGFETGIPILELEPLILAGIAFNLVAAFLPATGRFVDEEAEEESRGAGSLQNPKISLTDPKKFFGVTGFGFTKENELFVGRVAQLGFAAALIGEAVTGVGPLAQLGLETGIPLLDAEPVLLVGVILTLFTAINEGTGKFVDDDA